VPRHVGWPAQVAITQVMPQVLVPSQVIEPLHVGHPWHVMVPTQVGNPCIVGSESGEATWTAALAVPADATGLAAPWSLNFSIEVCRL